MSTASPPPPWSKPDPDRRPDWMGPAPPAPPTVALSTATLAALAIVVTIGVALGVAGGLWLFERLVTAQLQL